MNTELKEPQNNLSTMQRIQFAELEEENAKGDALVENINPLLTIKTDLEVCVGRISMSVGEFLATKEHQILVLDQTVDQEVNVLIEGRVVAKGVLVAVGDNFAVKITIPPKKI